MSFSSETAFAFFVLPAISIQITFEKIIKFCIEIFKIVHFNNARAVIVDEIQRIVNVILYQQSIVLFLNASIDFEQILIQVVQVKTFNSNDYYNCVKFEHKINDCPKMNQLMNSDLIHFKKQKKCILIELNKQKRKYVYNMNCFVLKLLVSACSKSIIHNLLR